MAHELRTPVANVSPESGNDAWMRSGNQRKTGCRAAMRSQAGFLALFLDLEKLRQMETENMNLELEPVNLLELAQAVETAFEPDLKEKAHL